MAIAYLGLGSNLGNREANLRMALRGLRRLSRLVEVSSLYETEPEGPPQPSFYNAVCAVETGLEPRSLLRFLKALEREIGRRPAGAPAAPRPIDIDVLLYESLVLDDAEIVVPHPRMTARAFVLVPLAEIAPQVVHPPSGRAVRELLDAVSQEGVRRIAPRGWDGVLESESGVRL
jgi:2-amino-4-hydroxy-6-hydroxymethyldihydropteridine diphosphokinase